MEELINDLKIDLPDAPENKLKLLIKKATVQIRNYMNKDLSDTIIQTSDDYKYALEQIVIDTYLYQKTRHFKEGIVKMSEGNRSIEYKSNSNTGKVILTEEVKTMLPTPFVRLMG